jgi:uncharacterized protein YycO
MHEYQKKGLTKRVFRKHLILKDMFAVDRVATQSDKKKKAAAWAAAFQEFPYLGG